MEAVPVDDKDNHQLSTALECGDFQTALSLLPKDGPPITIGPEGFTPLHYACRHGDAEAMRLLTTYYKYSTCSSSKRGHTPAHLAAQYGHIDALKVLVDLTKNNELCINTSISQAGKTSLSDDGALQCNTQPINSLSVIDMCQYITSCKDHEGETLLHLAARNGHLLVVKYLVDEVGCPTSPTDEHGRTPLYLAAGSGQLEVVRYFTQEKNCDPNAGTTKRWITAVFDLAQGRTPLHNASREGHLNVVRFLVDVLKCDPACTYGNGVTPLYLAAGYGHLPIVKFLVESGCEPMVRKANGRTPVHCGSQNGHLDTVKYFASTDRVDLSCQDKNGATPLLLAAANGYLPVVQFLTDSGCDPMVVAVDSRSLLHYAVNPLLLAAEGGHLSVVQFLIESGCDLLGTATKLDGRTPLHCASQNGYLDTVKYFASIDRVDLSCRDKNGCTPLSLAAESGHLPVVQFLVESGCDPMVRNIHSRTPLHYTSKNLDTAKNLASTDRVDRSYKDTPLSPATECGHQPGNVQFLVESGCDPIVRNVDSRTPLHYASQKGHLNIVKYLASTDRVDLSCHDNDGVTPLSLAAELGHLPVVQFLVESGCDPMDRNVDGRTPLHYASQNGHLGTVKYLASTDRVDLSCQDKNGVSPLILAAECGQQPVVQFLVESGCDPMVREFNGRTPLHFATQNGHLDTVKYFAIIDPVDLSCQDKTRVTPLSLAAEGGHLPVVQFLVDSGCDPMVAMLDGRIPLHCASQNGHLETVVLFTCIDWVDISYQDKKGFTPLSLASWHGHLPVVQFLVESGCDPMMRNINGRIALHFASQNGHLETVKFITSINRVDLSCLDKKGFTPLSLAAWCGHLPVVQFLVESGCDPMGRNMKDRTPLHFASRNGHLEIVKYFASINRVDLSCQDKNGVSPLLLAAECGHLPVVQFLVESGCDPMVKGVGGIIPLHLACQNGHLETVKYFASIDRVDLSYRNGNGLSSVRIAAHFNHLNVVLFLHSKGEPIPGYLKAFEPLSPLVNIYVVGNQSSGKSSLVKALSTEGSWFGRLVNVGGVVPETAGILPSEFDSKVYGRVTFYDFAGHPEYYSSHEAVFENASHPIVVVVVDLSRDHHSIGRALRYWRLLLHSSISAAGAKAHVIVVGSHGDVIQSRDLISKSALLEQFGSTSVLLFVGKCVLDCRKSASPGMSNLHALLRNSCTVVRVCTDFDYENGIKLKKFLSVSLSRLAVCKLNVLLKKIQKSANPELQPLKSARLLYQTCESLNTSGHLLFLKNSNNPEESWLVLKKEAILSELSGLLKHLQQCSPLGIVPLSKLKGVLEEHIPDLASDLAVRYMTSMLFCSEVNSQALKLLQLSDFQTGRLLTSSEETHYFFPSLVNIAQPAQVWAWPPTHPYVYACSWQLKCTDPDTFFTPRFLQTLQMDMVSKFALKVPSSTSGLLEPEKGCRLWLNGIRWIRNGIEAVMHVATDNTILGLMLRCVEGQEMECVRLRSELIKQVFNIQSLINNTMETSEYLVHPYFVKELVVPDTASLPLSELATAIVRSEENFCLDDPALECVPGYPHLQVQRLLYFEPFTGFGVQRLRELFDQQYLSKLIKPSTLRKLAGALHNNWKPVAVVLQTPSDILAAVDSKNMSEFDKCLSILKEWAHREGTYSALCRDLGQYSIFCGRNPLDTPGITLPRISYMTADNQPSDIDDLNEEKTVLLQGIPTLHQLLCMYPNGDRSQRAVRTLAVVAPKWEVLAFCLEFEEHIVQTIARNNMGDCEGACRDMFGHWLGGSCRRPVTWETLIRALYETDESWNTLCDQLVDIFCRTPTHTSRVMPEDMKKGILGVNVSADIREALDLLPGDLSQHAPDVAVAVYKESAVEGGENVQ